MITALIVDDEPWARKTIRLLLERDPEITILGECGSGEEALEAITQQRPALVFLDVQMPGLDGLGVAEALGVNGPAIVFCTAYDQYALKAFDVSAIDYLLKPFDDQRFQRALDRAKQSIRGQGPSLNRLVIRGAGRIAFVNINEIDWIEAADYCATLHVSGREHILRKSLDKLDQELSPQGFCRVHRSAIVNLSRVQEIRSDSSGNEEVLLRDQTRIRLSKTYRETLISRLA